MTAHTFECPTMLKILRDEISRKTGLNCVQISVDLLDDISEVKGVY